MTDVKVEQCDRVAFAELRGMNGPVVEEMVNSGRFDTAPEMLLLARHRQAAEKAQQERDAGYIEGKGGVIPGATVFVSLITGENMPCMSGDARDKLNSHKRRQFDDATRDLATAIRSQNDDR